MNAKKEPVTRLYVVRDMTAKVPEGGTPPIIALVHGASTKKVTDYMADKSFSVEYASQRDIIAAVKAGIEEETVVVKTDSETEQP